MLLLSESITLTKEQFKKVSDFEFKHYKSDTHLALFKRHFETKGFLPIGVVDVDFITVYPKTDTLEFQLTDEENQVFHGKIEVLVEEEFHPTYIMVMATAPAMAALSADYELEHIYSFASILSARIEVGDPASYPKYVSQLLPKHVDNYEYGTEDAQMLAMRFTHIGEQRTSHNLLRTSVIARYVIEASEKTSNNGFSEIYPVVLHGNLVEFNGIVQYPHELHIPVDNDTDIEYNKEIGTTFIDSVTVCEAGNVYWLDTVSGSKRQAN